jgi:hypothetical protein
MSIRGGHATATHAQITPSRIDAMLRFTTAQLCRVGVGGGGSSSEPIVLSSDDESEGAPAPPVVPATDVSASTLRRALRIQESGIVRGQPGLFSVQSIPANTFVCVYVYDRVLSDAQVYAMSVAKRAEVARYAVAGPTPEQTLIINMPITDPVKHVAAFANEPLDGETANMSLHAERVTIADGRTYYVVALYTCDAPVAAGSELTWNYGGSYASIRSAEGYRAGRGCTSKEPLDPPLEEVVSRIVSARGDDLTGILYPLGDASSSESDSSDGEYVERGLHAQQPRRVQPRRW